MKKQITLTVTFLNKTYLPNSRKIAKVTEGNSYVYYGATKKSCEQQARNRFRWNGYKKTWATEPTND